MTQNSTNFAAASAFFDAALIARIKIVSGLDISEKRRPQDGRATSIVDRQEYDIRVSVLPTVYGEKVVMRLAQKKALTLDKRDLGFPEDELKKFDHILSHPNGLILVTGPTGSGKSTTLASLIDVINKERNEHIITLEDPLEFLHRHKKSIVSQREVSSDTESYKVALRASLRQSPNVILLGEMRDYETINIAMTAAETGHLVFSTLHTLGAANAVDRIIDVFLANQQRQIIVQLASVLNAVVSQQLLPDKEGKLIPAFELMTVNRAIKNMIRDNKVHQIDGLIGSSGQEKMFSMDFYITKLYKEGRITRETAIDYATAPELMAQKLGK